MAHVLGTLLTVPCSETASGISISGLTEPGRQSPVLLCALFMLQVTVVAFEHELALQGLQLGQKNGVSCLDLESYQ